MSPHASFIPPEVTPPDPPEAKVVAFAFSAFMSVVLILFIGYVSIDFLTDIFWHSVPHDARQELTFSEQHESLLLEFLGIPFPEQDFDKGFGYELTAEDRARAIRRLQEMLQHTEDVSVEITGWDDQQHYTTERFWLFYDNDLATELCEQANFIKGTFIAPSLNNSMIVPDVVFTFYPSEVKVNVRDNTSPSPLLTQALSLNVAVSEDVHRWEGNFGEGLLAALLNARLRNGETVRSSISARLPFFPLP